MNRNPKLEMTLVIITGLLKLVMMNWLNLKLEYIVAACIFWGGYVWFYVRRDPTLWRYWGFSKHNLKETTCFLLPYAIISVVLFLGWGFYHDVDLLNWHILPILFVYPLWGLIQQFLVVGLIAGNLKDGSSFQLPDWLIIFFTSFMFGIIHYPHLPLILGTFLLAIFYTYVFLRWRNLWPLGLFHGLLGSVFIFYVLERDLWNEIFLIYSP